MGNRPAGMTHEKAEQIELLWSEMDRLPRFQNEPASRVQFDIANRNHGVLALLRQLSTANGGPQPRHELFHAEGLSYIVVGTRIQSLDLAVLRIIDRNNQNREAG